MPPFSSTIKKELLSVPSIIIVSILTIIYIVFSMFLLNYRLVLQTITGITPFSFKIALLDSLVLGSWTGLSHVDFMLLIVSAVLIACNFLLIGKTIAYLKYNKKVHLSIGGATIISIVSTGCASCGLSLFSILGLSTSLSFLPLHGMELHLLSILLLIASGIYMLKKLHASKYCKIR